MNHNLPDPKYVRTVVNYDPDTGILTWSLQRRGVRLGAECGRLHPTSGYREMGLGRLVHSHRVAWAWMTGEWPMQEIDHINRIRNDNRWCNLRLASRSQNNGNEWLRTTNTTGFKGVVWDSERQKWRAQICVNRVKKNLGRFDCIEDAKAAHDKAAREAFGSFAYVNEDAERDA